MIDLDYWTTPNGHKITIFLEETELPYRINPVNIGAGDQFKPDFPPAPGSCPTSGGVRLWLPNLNRSFDAIGECPVVKRAYARATEINTQPPVSEESKKVLFGLIAATVAR